MRVCSSRAPIRPVPAAHPASTILLPSRRGAWPQMQTPPRSDQMHRKHCRDDFREDVVTAVRAKRAVQDWRIVSEGDRFVAVQEKRVKAEVSRLCNWHSDVVRSACVLRENAKILPGYRMQ